MAPGRPCQTLTMTLMCAANLTDIQAELGTYKTLTEYAQAFSS